MRHTYRDIIGLGTAVLILTALICAATTATAHEGNSGPEGMPVAPPKASDPQNETNRSAPETEDKELPAAETEGRPLEAYPEELGAPPTIQFSVSISTVDFGSSSLTPRETPYTHLFSTTVNSNTAWQIIVTKDHDLQGASNTIPSEYFYFMAEGPPGKTTYQAPQGTQFGTNILAVEGTRGTNLISTMTYSLSLPWSIEADNYSATHTFTAMSI